MKLRVFQLATIALAGLLAAAAADSATPVRTFAPGKVVNPQAYYPEGPQLLDDGALLVAEMARDRVVKIAPDGAVTTVWGEADCGPTSVKKLPTGGYWVLCHLGGRVVRLSENFGKLTQVDQTLSGRRLVWPNDGSVDSHGNLYLSSSGLFSLAAQPEGRVVRIDAASNLAVDLVSGLRYTNGVRVQERYKRVLVSETLNRRMWNYPLTENGGLGKGELFFDFKNAPVVPDAYDQSGPDGIAEFDNGDVIVADYGNGRLIILTHDGKYIDQLKVPLRYVTNMAITKDQKSMYVVMTRDNSSSTLDGIVQRYELSSKDKK